MTNSSPEPDRGSVLRGAAAAQLTSARFDNDLRTHRYLRTGHDPRLLDPSLDRAFGEATAQARASAQAEGYTAGYAAGRAAAAAAAAAEREAERVAVERATKTRLDLLDRAAAALADAATSFALGAVPTYAEAAEHLGPIAMQVVEALLGRELELAPATVLDAVRRALTAAPVGAAVQVQVNPADAATLAELLPELETELGRPVRVVPDAAVAPGGAVAVHEAAHVEVCLGDALERVRAELCA